MIEQQMYNIVMNQYESVLDDLYRAKYGIFYTDTILAEKIIKSLNIPSNATILDPCCGVGSFLYAAYKNNYLFLYGADCDSKAVAICSQYVPYAKLVTEDTIGNPSNKLLELFNITDKFDYVVGNPPYVLFLTKLSLIVIKLSLTK